MSDIHIVKKPIKLYIFTARCEYFTTGREIDKKVVVGLFHAEEVENKHFEPFVLKKLVANKNHSLKLSSKQA